ncbi:claudin-7-like isoform X1 [Rhea pennata]|uniref:claudin-7-like isoform X1 n=1 Tax=Rhea pennata TaxID=8795 RepID=UPI002E261CA0
MANAGLQLLGFGLAVAGWLALLVATVLPQWQMSSYAGDSIITAVAMYKGLWMSCVSQSTGQIQCKVYDSLLSLSAALQATRALMVVSGVLGVIGIAISTMGMKCTRCGGDDKVQKARIAMAGGIIFIVAGLAALVACSWNGHQIVSDFYNPTVPVNLKYEFGPAIFVGWAGSALVLLGGALLACSCSGGTSGGTSYPRAKATHPPSSREYV